MGHKKPSFIEKIAEKLKIIPDLHGDWGTPADRLTEEGDLTNFPPHEQWNDWVEYEAKSWPLRDKKHYSIVPTTCFNCESACGLTAFIDKETNTIRKLRGILIIPAAEDGTVRKGRQPSIS